MQVKSRLMAQINIAGIMRAGAFSPNHVGNDAAIFNIVADELRKRGCVVNVYSEEQFMNHGTVEEPVIINMCRERGSLELLQKLEDSGRIVINSGYGLENCIRERMTRILLGSGVPHPKSLIVSTDEMVEDRLSKAGIEQAWIKRGDYHAQHKEDVTFVHNAREAQEVLKEYFLRGIPRAVINDHVAGDMIKFYGIRDEDFFFSFFPFDKTGEEIPESHRTFDQRKLRDICQTAAEELGIVIYGGDAILSADGSLCITDFNDWPSFAACRESAATPIAKAIMNVVKKSRKDNAHPKNS